MIPMFVLKSVEKVENQVSVFFTSGETWMESGKVKHMESLGIPLFREIGVEVDPPISPVELELDHSKNQFQRIGIGVWNCKLILILFQ